MNKTCFKCGEEKPLSDFYSHPKMGDKHLGKCKACAKIDVVTNRALNLEYYQRYDRERKNQPHRLAQRRYNSKQYYKRHPTKARANHTLRRAVKSGRVIKRPCEICGSPNADAHHDNYSKPLDVKWLCPLHHHAAHRKYNYDNLIKDAAQRSKPF